ncbi:MAG: hypothetical protein HQL43_16545 [Alphaproteobacteria bacterium]|nr:hypothetical protein [Alphaproteobacteria bacterium]
MMSVLLQFFVGLFDPPCTKCLNSLLSRPQRAMSFFSGAAAALCAIYFWDILANLAGVGFAADAVDWLQWHLFPWWLRFCIYAVGALGILLSFRSGQATVRWLFLRLLKSETALMSRGEGTPILSRCKCIRGKRELADS